MSNLDSILEYVLRLRVAHIEAISFFSPLQKHAAHTPTSHSIKPTHEFRESETLIRSCHGSLLQHQQEDRRGRRREGGAGAVERRWRG